MKNIVLIGFMGTGKSSVGRILAKRAKREFVDLDRYLEAREKRKIRDIFEKEGEAYFRALEKEAVLVWAAGRNKVITTGGGTVVDPENFAALKENGILVTLVAANYLKDRALLARCVDVSTLASGVSTWLQVRPNSALITVHR